MIESLWLYQDSRIRCKQLRRARDGYELLKNDDTSSEDEDSWNEDDVKEYWRQKYRFMSDATNISHDDDDIDDDDLSDKLQGFVDVKEEGAQEVCRTTTEGPS